ncbi:MAG: MFS transporter [Bacteroidia bacterium]|nr:MFS transporter [Bacteroidia bacterium]MDW8302008.1 MFS transporter [Bacteroidia bacterium]
MSTTTASASLKTEKSILWKQVWALAALQAVNNFGFAAYYHYQPKLLERFNYVDFAMMLIILQGIIGIVLNPIMGVLGDRIRQTTNKSFVLVSIGTNAAGMVFMAVAAVMTQKTKEGFFHEIFPIAVTLWLITMAIFNSPAVSLLKSFAPNNEDLPKATAVMTLVGGIFAALHPFLFMITDILGLPITFALGGLLLMTASNVLRKLNRQVPLLTEEDKIQTPKLTLKLVIIFSIGVVNGFVFNFLLDIVPAISVKTLNLAMYQDEYVKSAIVFVSAIVAWFAGDWIKKMGAIRMTIAGIITLFVTLGLGISIPVAIITILVIIMAGVIRSILSISMLSYSMSIIHKVNAGKATGAFFCGVSAALAISQAVLLKFKAQGANEVLLWLQSIGLM